MQPRIRTSSKFLSRIMKSKFSFYLNSFCNKIPRSIIQSQKITILDCLIKLEQNKILFFGYKLIWLLATLKLAIYFSIYDFSYCGLIVIINFKVFFSVWRSLQLKPTARLFDRTLRIHQSWSQFSTSKSFISVTWPKRSEFVKNQAIS